MKKNEGITLIALIITIIILIILTAVTINNVIGTDLIGFATKAVENYTDAAKDEADKVDKLAGTLDNQGVGEDSIVRAGQIVEKTEKDNYTDADGRKATIPEGFKVSTKSSEQYIKDGLVIQDNDGNEFVWIPCYYGTKPEEIAEDVQQYKKHVYEGTDDQKRGTEDSGEGNWKTYTYTMYKNNWLDEATQKIENDQIVEDENAYGNKSVKTYGGFYIGRYEAGLPEKWQPDLTQDKPIYGSKIERNNTGDEKPISKANKFSWNFISQINAKSASEKMYEDSESVDSKLVDGVAWDTIVKWTETTGIDVNNSALYGNFSDTNKKYTGWHAEHIQSSQVAGQSGGTLGWLYSKYLLNESTLLNNNLLTEEEWNRKQGYYQSVDGNDTIKNNLRKRIELPTGSFDDFKLKNIYDLAGNMWEWTAEVGDHKQDLSIVTDKLFAVVRGGSFVDDSPTYPFCFRGGDVNTSYPNFERFGFRVVLYIK